MITGPAWIGDNCNIGPGVMLDNCTIGDNVSIDDGCVLMMSAVGNGSFLPFRSSLVSPRSSPPVARTKTASS